MRDQFFLGNAASGYERKEEFFQERHAIWHRSCPMYYKELPNLRSASVETLNYYLKNLQTKLSAGITKIISDYETKLLHMRENNHFFAIQSETVVVEKQIVPDFLAFFTEFCQAFHIEFAILVREKGEKGGPSKIKNSSEKNEQSLVVQMPPGNKISVFKRSSVVKEKPSLLAILYFISAELKHFETNPDQYPILLLSLMQETSSIYRDQAIVEVEKNVVYSEPTILSNARYAAGIPFLEERNYQQRSDTEEWLIGASVFVTGMKEALFVYKSKGVEGPIPKVYQPANLILPKECKRLKRMGNTVNLKEVLFLGKSGETTLSGFEKIDDTAELFPLIQLNREWEEIS